jgi:hypothetical protein
MYCEQQLTLSVQLGQVLRNSALNELEQLRKGDNLRLRKGKLTTGNSYLTLVFFRCPHHF